MIIIQFISVVMHELEPSSTSSSNEAQSKDAAYQPDPIPGTSSSKNLEHDVIVKMRPHQQIITSRLVAALDTCQIGDRDAVHLLVAAAKAFNIIPGVSLDANQLIIKHSSLYRQCQEMRSQKTQKIRNTFKITSVVVILFWGFWNTVPIFATRSASRQR